jgi:DNA-binding response OmpR family regulator
MVASNSLTPSGRVLIIDDEAVLRQTLTRILQAAGCETTAVASGLQALATLETTAFDLVYLDLHLPEPSGAPPVDGLQVLKDIRQRYPRLPVILLTGHGSLHSAVEALRLGAADYLLKPFDPAVLVARTHVLLHEQQIERRRREITEQIAGLQEQLKALDQPATATVAPAPVGAPAYPGSQDRFIKCGGLVLDLQARRAVIGATVLSLPPAAFDYLVVLARHYPAVVDYQTLVVEAQNYQVDANEARELAKWHVHGIRQACAADPENVANILTVRGTGYRLLLD